MKTYSQRLFDIIDDFEDLLTDVESYVDDGGLEARGIYHKLQEAYGPLSSAMLAAEQNGL